MAFYAETRDSIFLKNYSISDLFYCAVHTFYQASGFSRKLEYFIKTRLFWTFVAEKNRVSIESIYQSIYKYEYLKIIGELRVAQPVYFKYSFTESESSSSTLSSISKGFLKANVVSDAPKINKNRSVKVFSPLSQRIAAARGLRESLDSKRKLNFE